MQNLTVYISISVTRVKLLKKVVSFKIDTNSPKFRPEMFKSGSTELGLIHSRIGSSNYSMVLIFTLIKGAIF